MQNNQSAPSCLYVSLNNVAAGPFSEEEVNRMLEAGEITLTTWVCLPGTNEWRHLADFAKPQTFVPWIPPTLPPPLPKADAKISPKTLCGIDGWLLIFCACLTILGPLCNIGSLKNLFDTLDPRLSNIPGFRDSIIVASVIVGFVSAYGIITGLLIWARVPWAIKQAKVFLYSRAVLAMVRCLCLIFIPDIPSREFEAYAETALISMMIPEGMYFFVWMSYLKKSKRVANTFPENKVGGVQR